MALGKVLSVSSNSKDSLKVLNDNIFSFWEGSECVTGTAVLLGLDHTGNVLSFAAPPEGECVEHVEVAVAPVHTIR